MRRSERLGEIVEIVRDGRLHRAGDIAEALGVSVRTIYRDLDTLVASGLPIDGERGVGYMLREPILLPALNLSVVEMEALHLGMSIVAEAADEELQAAACTLTTKIGQAAPVARELPERWGFGVYPFAQARPGFAHMPLIRRAIRERCVLALDYHALDGGRTSRTVRPLQVEYWGRVWTLTSWCERREDFRVFRTDRIERCEATGARFKDEAGRLLEDHLQGVESQMAEKRARALRQAEPSGKTTDGT